MQFDEDLTSKQPLVQVSMWTFGEFADLLIRSSNTEELNNESVTEHQMIDKCEEVLSSLQMTIITKEYTLNALIKLSVRFPEQAPRIKQIVDLFGCSHSIELQQRAVEFTTLFSKHNHLRPSVLEKMPQMTKSERRTEAETESEVINQQENSPQSNKVELITQSNSSALLDLLDLSPPNDIINVPSTQTDTKVNLSAANDVLDLLGSLNNATSPVNFPTISNDKASSELNNLDVLFGNSTPAMPVLNGNNNSNSILDSIDSNFVEKSVNSLNSIPPITAYEKNGVKIVFNFEKSIENPLLLSITLIANNNTDSVIEDFLFQAAVPKVIGPIIFHY